MNGCLRGKRLFKPDGRRQLFEFDFDQIGGVARGLPRMGDHHGHFLAGEANAILRQERPLGDEDFLAVAPGQRSNWRKRAKSSRRNVVARDHRNHARQPPGSFHIERTNTGVGTVGTFEVCVKLSRQIPVVAIAALAGYKSLILPATFECRNHGSEPITGTRNLTARIA